MSQAVSLLPRLFAEAGNVLRSTAQGFKTGHEPVHTSSSSIGVTIDARCRSPQATASRIISC